MITGNCNEANMISSNAALEKFIKTYLLIHTRNCNLTFCWKYQQDGIPGVHGFALQIGMSEFDIDPKAACCPNH